MYSIEEYNVFNNYMLKELEKKGVHITDVFMCPHIDEDNSECRKPKLKMYYDAIEKYDIDLNKSFVIGDRIRDLSLCDNEPIKGILITEDNNEKFIYKKSLYDSALYIKNKEKS
jgi:histidinol-phosphate phosphatase family protein